MSIFCNYGMYVWNVKVNGEEYVHLQERFLFGIINNFIINNLPICLNNCLLHWMKIYSLSHLLWVRISLRSKETFAPNNSNLYFVDQVFPLNSGCVRGGRVWLPMHVLVFESFTFQNITKEDLFPQKTIQSLQWTILKSEWNIVCTLRDFVFPSIVFAFSSQISQQIYIGWY